MGIYVHDCDKANDVYCIATTCQTNIGLHFFPKSLNRTDFLHCSDVISYRHHVTMYIKKHVGKKVGK